MEGVSKSVIGQDSSFWPKRTIPQTLRTYLLYQNFTVYADHYACTLVDAHHWAVSGTHSMETSFGWIRFWYKVQEGQWEHICWRHFTPSYQWWNRSRRRWWHPITSRSPNKSYASSKVGWRWPRLRGYQWTSRLHRTGIRLIRPSHPNPRNPSVCGSTIDSVYHVRTRNHPVTWRFMLQAASFPWEGGAFTVLNLR